MSDEIRAEIKAAAKALCHYPSGPNSVNSCCQGIGECEMKAATAEITRLRAELATARRDGMEEAAQRLEELHKNHGYNPQTGEVWSLGKLVTCPLTIDHSIGYYRAIAEGVAHIRAAAGEGK